MASRLASLRRRIPTAAVALSIPFTMAPYPSLVMLPKPRAQEWWFSTWDIQRKVWPISTGKGVTVAILDSGINASLPDLAGAVLPGTDLTGRNDDGRADLDTEDGGHGTGMAALIVGQGRVTGMAGIAPGVKILPITVDRANSNRNGGDTVADGIRYAAKHGAKVISISLGTANAFGSLRCDYYQQGAVDYAVKHDVVIVAAAGNEGDTSNGSNAPAACPGVLAVGAVDYQNRPWFKTQRQPYVAVAAPGVDVGSIGKAGIFSNNAGTSSATALTAGVAALVRSQYPHMSAREVVQRIIASTLDSEPKGVDQQTGYGLVRPYHALVDQVPKDSPNPVFIRWDEEQHPSATPKPPSPTPKLHVAINQSSRDGMRSVYLVVSGLLLVAFILGTAIAIQRRKNSGPKASVEGRR